MGLEPFVFTACESARIQETPEINWSTFLEVFGGRGGVEELHCSNRLGPIRFLCLNRTKQPFAPTTPGAPGLLLRAPVPLVSLDDHKTSNTVIAPCRYSHDPVEAPSLKYHGIYKTVTTIRTTLTPDEWAALPISCRQCWINHFMSVRSPDACAMRTRIRLRNRLGREPSLNEIKESLAMDNLAILSWAEISTAFKLGHIRMQIQGMSCVGYDSGLATIIQKHI
ncbi:hypothetical protein BC834DRAFT_35806 [Gloeopeniophorella convolvens]|nr:hypothetical protein BC834DRAFT_35806 [Gloeopeniophorella convolvens]